MLIVILNDICYIISTTEIEHEFDKSKGSKIMREMLFRGKRKDNGEWFYGDLLQNVDCLKIREQEKEIKYIPRSFEIIPETVGQYTGLTDKNGTKIFEGDILQTTTIDTNEDVKALVGFGEFVDENNDDEYLGFYIEFSGIKTTITQLLDEDTKDDFNIVGNIHDNPEVLEEWLNYEIFTHWCY